MARNRRIPYHNSIHPPPRPLRRRQPFLLARLLATRASRNLARTMPAPTAMTTDSTAPISSLLKPCSLATPK